MSAGLESTAHKRSIQDSQAREFPPTRETPRASTTTAMLFRCGVRKLAAGVAGVAAANVTMGAALAARAPYQHSALSRGWAATPWPPRIQPACWMRATAPAGCAARWWWRSGCAASETRPTTSARWRSVCAIGRVSDPENPTPSQTVTLQDTNSSTLAHFPACAQRAAGVAGVAAANVTAGAARTVRSSTSKNSAATNPNAPASRFAGNSCVRVLKSRTFAL